MKRQSDENLPQIRGEGGEIIDPQSERALQELESDDRTMYFMRLRETCRRKAREILDKDSTFSVGSGKRGVNQSGVQALATHFNVEAWAPPEEVVVRWEENEPFLRAHRAGNDVPPGVAPVPEHVSVQRTAYARTPWGHLVSRSATCSSRGKHFWHSSGGYNTSKYHDGAEHICAGIAETRAIARAVKAALMIGGDSLEAEDLEETEDDRRRKEEKRRQTELLAAKQEWESRLSSMGILPDEETAFRVVIQKVPDTYDEWDAGDYRTAVRIADVKGKDIFTKCLGKYEENGGTPTDDGQEPPEATEEEESDERSPADPEGVDERPETEASSVDERPEDEEAEDEDPGPEYGPEEVKRRKTFIQSIEATCRLMGESRAYAEAYAGRKWGDGTPIELEDLSTEDLARVDKAMSAEITDGGG